MDIATIAGLVLALVGLIGGFSMEGGSPMALLNVPAAIIVFGGTIGAALITVPLSGFMILPKVVMKALFGEVKEPDLVGTFVALAERARREGLLSLEQEAQSIEHPAMKKGIMLVVDGIEPEVVSAILENESYAMGERHEHGFAILETMGGFGPTMGVIGTVMGLVNVLSNLDDPGELGHLIAGAFIATQAGDNPRVVKEKLEAFLPPAHRGHSEGGDHKGGAAEKAA